MSATAHDEREPVHDADCRPRPLISVVIPIYNGRKYLAACLDSIMGQPFPDIEVIAVNGHSTDKRIGPYLDRYGMQDGRLQVINLEQNGPGVARNRGIKEARGEYVWFVDADDVLTSTSLQDVANEIGLSSPEVLIIDFDYLYARGKRRPSPGRELLGRAPSGYCHLTEHPWLADLTMTSWSKIVRREFLNSTGLSFEAGIHEDVPYSCSLLLEAKHIRVLSKVCYVYRQKRRGAFMASTSPAHLDIFSSYRHVLDDVEKRLANDDRRVTPEVQAALFRRAIWHYTTILAHGGLGIGPVGFSGLVPRRLHRKFFEDMHKDFVRYRPPGFEPGTGFRATKYKLIEQDRYWRYSALESLNKLRVRFGAFVRAARRPDRIRN
jgi:CDP-glycerol glycerophosphotransferase